jgi:hypothetical protein
VKHTALIMGAITLFMVAAVWADWPWWEYAFLSDDTPVSWLSSALLISTATAALMLTLSRSLTPTVGCCLTTALAFLSLDEQFLFHERWKEAVGGFLGNLPTATVGIGGVAFVAHFFRSTRSNPARYLLAGGVIVGLFALWVDLGDPPKFLARTEEGFEVLAEGFFLCGLLERFRVHVQSGS